MNFVNSVVSCDILHHKEVYGVNSGKGRSSTPNYFKTTVHMFKIIQDFFIFRLLLYVSNPISFSILPA